MNRFALALAFLPLPVAAAFGLAAESAVFDRSAVAEGEVFRLLSAHWIHVDPMHLVLNVAGAILAAALLSGRRWFEVGVLYAAGMVFVSGGVWLFAPQVQVYCGLSGVLNCVVVGGLGLASRDRVHARVVFVIALLWFGKLAGEQNSGASLVTSTAWPVWPGAHLAGAVGGVVSGSLLTICDSAGRLVGEASRRRWVRAG